MTTRADLIETAAKTLFEIDGGTFPKDCTVPEDYRRDAAAVVDAILPQITTAEQLDAVPVNSRLVGPDGAVWRRPPLAGYLEKLGGHDEGHWDAEDALSFGPLTVVWQPQPEQETKPV